jgi:hypothetical protein
LDAVNGSADSMPDRVSVPRPARRVAIAIAQFCDTTSLSPLRPPWRLNVPKITLLKPTLH